MAAAPQSMTMTSRYCSMPGPRARAISPKASSAGGLTERITSLSARMSRRMVITSAAAGSKALPRARAMSIIAKMAMLHVL